MATVIIKVAGGMVQEVLMDEPLHVFVLDYDRPLDYQEPLLQVEGESCLSVDFTDIVDADRVHKIVHEVLGGGC